MPTATCDWTVQDTVCLNGFVLRPGTELAILGERGKFKFLRYVTRPDGHCWIDVIGGPAGVTKFRSFRPARVSNAN